MKPLQNGTRRLRCRFCGKFALTHFCSQMSQQGIWTREQALRSWASSATNWRRNCCSLFDRWLLLARLRPSAFFLTLPEILFSINHSAECGVHHAFFNLVECHYLELKSSGMRNNRCFYMINYYILMLLFFKRRRIMIRTIIATRYVTPLREGGSLPAIVEADDDGLYVLKFRGAGQGPKALIAELVAGELARVLALPVPEIVCMELDPALGRSEPDFEVQALIKASAGLNLALDYLPGSVAFDALDADKLDPLLASSIVWFDAYVTNVDRTPRNTNMLWWHKRLMLIDHGAALYFHHIEGDYLERSRISFSSIKGHVLLPVASALAEVDALLKSRLSPAVLQDIVNLIPESWLEQNAQFADSAAHRMAYVSYLQDRLEHSHIFVEEAIHARAQLV